jgi:hypothetical protein
LAIETLVIVQKSDFVAMYVHDIDAVKIGSFPVGNTVRICAVFYKQFPYQLDELHVLPCDEDEIMLAVKQLVRDGLHFLVAVFYIYR